MSTRRLRRILFFSSSVATAPSYVKRKRPRLIAEAIELLDGSDWLDGQGDGFMDLAEIYRLRGRINDALEAVAQALARFTAKGNIVSARRADELAASLRAAQARTAQDPPRPAVPGCAG